MGLFDAMNNPETMGLLAAAANILQTSGPSTKPMGLGQILGGGLMGGMQGYQQAQQQQRENALRELQTKQANMGLEKGGMELQQLRDTIDRNKRIRDRTMGINSQSSAPLMQEQPGIPSGGDMSSNPPPLFGQNNPPQSAAAPSMQPPKQNATKNLTDRLSAQAKIYQEEGDFEGAIKLWEQAAKFMPKVKSWETVNDNGKILRVPYFEDGTAGTPVPFEVAEKLHFANTGGTTVGMNPFTGGTVSAVRNTQSPDSAASTSVQIRGQNLTNARASENIGLRERELNQKTAGINKPLPVQALKLQLEAKDAADTADGINDRLAKAEEKIATGKLSFGPVKNLTNQALNFAGMSTEESRNLASFKADLEKLRNDSLRLNKGVQTEGDSQRAWNEILTNINDKELVKQRLAEVKQINERAKNLRLMEVDTINRNYGRSGDASADALGGTQNDGVKPPLPPDMQTPTKPKALIDYGYNSPQDAIKDARNAMLRNPSAKAEIIRRLESSGITNHGFK